MKVLTSIFVLILAAAAFAQGQNDTNPPEVSNPDDAGTTAKPTTTTAGSTKTQTTTPTTATTTALPEPSAGTWHVNGTKDYACILVKLGAQFTVNYTYAENKTLEVHMNMPSEANVTKASGTCGNTSQTIMLTYDPGCSMTMVFQNVNKKFSVKEVDVNFVPACFSGQSQQPTKNVTGNLGNQTLFSATVGQSYLCNSDQSIKLSNDIKIDLLDVQVQAFANSKDLKFGAEQECPQDAETSNIVPIAVGAALAALVLIVLIAYLISRNRGQRGYESV